MRIENKSILVIDDDPGMLRALGKVLASEGAVVTSAVWGGDAADHLADPKKRFDLVITDLRMPIVSGGSILLAVKGAFPHLPVIVLSAHGCPEVKAQCREMGAAAFLEKPLDTGQLIQAIHAALSPRTEFRV